MRYLLTILTVFAGLSCPVYGQELATASIVAADSPVSTLALPVNLTAEDLITKVYGILDRDLSRPDILEASRSTVNITPQEDEYGLWLETEDGFSISYYGMTPEISARAAFDNDDKVTDYGFFFLFPYSEGEREVANSQQARFSGSMLQEMLDIGIEMEVDTLSDALFEVIGDYDRDTVDVRLIEEYETDDGSGRFILILSVEPDNPDHWTATGQ